MSSLRWYLLGIGIVILLVIYFFGRKREPDDAHDVFADIGSTPQSDPLLKHELPRQRVEPDVAPSDLKLASERDFHRDDMELVTDPDTIEQEGINPEAWLEPELPLQPEFLDTSPPEYDAVGTETGVIPEIEMQPEPGRPALQLVIMYVVAADTNTPFPGAAVQQAFHAHKLRFGDLDIYHRFTGTGSDAAVVFSISNMHEPGTLKPADLATAEISGLSFFMKVPAPNDARQAYDDMLHVAQHLASTLGGTLRDDAFEILGSETIAYVRSQLARV